MIKVVGYTQPTRDVSENSIELLNEAFALIYSYHLYLFTGFMTDLENRALIGSTLTYISMFNVALNLIVLTIRTLSIALRRSKLEYYKFKQKQ